MWTSLSSSLSSKRKSIYNSNYLPLLVLLLKKVLTNDNNIMEEPLLKQTMTDAQASLMSSPSFLNHEKHMDHHFQSFKVNSLFLGLMVGFLVECITMAGYAELQQLASDSEGKPGLTHNVILCMGVAWALATIVLVPCFILFVLKRVLLSFILLQSISCENGKVENRVDVCNSCNCKKLIRELTFCGGMGCFCGESIVILLVNGFLDHGQKWRMLDCAGLALFVILPCLCWMMKLLLQTRDTATTSEESGVAIWPSDGTIEENLQLLGPGNDV
jgi:hypothetical protein